MRTRVGSGLLTNVGQILISYFGNNGDRLKKTIILTLVKTGRQTLFRAMVIGLERAVVGFAVGKGGQVHLIQPEEWGCTAKKQGVCVCVRGVVSG